MSTTFTAKRYGYCRVSTAKQTLAQQQDALSAAGVDPADIYCDIMSGAKRDRPGLAEVRGHLRPGDELHVVALDRLGRTLAGILRTLEELTANDIRVVSYREGVNMTTAAGRACAGMFAVMSQLERELIIERSMAAREARKARGLPVGPPRKLTADQAELVCRMKEAGESASTICRTLGISRTTFYRTLARVDFAQSGDAA